MCYFHHFFHFLIEKNRKCQKMQFLTQKNGLKTTKSHEKGVENVQMGQKYVKRGQKGPKWANTDQRGLK